MDAREEYDTWKCLKCLDVCKNHNVSLQKEKYLHRFCGGNCEPYQIYLYKKEIQKRFQAHKVKNFQLTVTINENVWQVIDMQPYKEGVVEIRCQRRIGKAMHQVITHCKEELLKDIPTVISMGQNKNNYT